MPDLTEQENQAFNSVNSSMKHNVVDVNWIKGCFVSMKSLLSNLNKQVGFLFVSIISHLL